MAAYEGWQETEGEQNEEREETRQEEVAFEANCEFWGDLLPECREGGSNSTTVTAPPADFPTTTFADQQAAVEPTCPPESTTETRLRFKERPDFFCIDPSQTYFASVETNWGDFEIHLDDALAPQTVNNFVFLARWNFYDGVAFEYKEPNGVLRIGDPAQTTTPGQGGPGYELPVEVGELQSGFPRIAVVMASGSESGVSHGSQFVIVIGSDDRRIFEQSRQVYTLFGEVTDGVWNISSVDTQRGLMSRGQPDPPIVIEDITIRES